MSDKRISKISLVPLALGLALVFGLLVYQVFGLEKEKLAEESTSLFDTSQKMISQWLLQDSQSMGVAMAAMMSNESLQAAMQKKDAAALGNITASALERLKEDHHIGRLYFHDTSRKNILSAHEPDRSSGVEQNHILMQSEATQASAWGLNPDSAGEIWLRMSQPWLKGGKLIGYIELEKNIYGLGANIKQVLGLDFYLLVLKDSLSKEAWNKKRGAHGESSWGLTDKYALSYASSEAARSALPELIEAGDSGSIKRGQLFTSGDFTFMGAVFPIMVAGEKQAGAIVVARDVTAMLGASRKTILKSGIISMVAGVALIGILFLSVGRIEKGLSVTEATYKRSEEELHRLTAAVEQAGDSIMITDPEGNIQYVNPAFVKITGFTRTEVLGKKPSIVKSGKHNARFYKKMWNTIKAGKVWSGHFINRKKNGALYEEESTISPIFDSDNKIMNFIAIKSDVTLISSLTKAREYFTSVTSHELATPIQRLGFVRTLMSGMLKQNQEDESLNKIVQALDSSYTDLQRVQSATNLLAHLSFNKVEETGRNIFIQPVLSASVENALDESRQEGRDVKINLDVGSIPIKAQLFGKQDLMQQAIDEVLSNAIKYTPDGKEVTITVKLEGTLLEIGVHDQGRGMTDTTLEQIFEPFFSPSSPSYHSTGRYKFEGGGMGLGLTITRMIVEYHGGSLDLQSKGSDKGTTTRIILPVFV
ncbi:MAG: ATP-binding protein [Nitrospinota bacterium]|nr:ATP-binding protein [Nitrospinota bacterium]